jgi:rhodanese-related sulfurtransferase
MAALTPIAPQEAQALVAAGRAMLVDVRERQEQARERIAGAAARPLSAFDGAAATGAAGAVIFLCASGARTAANAHRLAGAAGECYALAGGLAGWKAAGLPTVIDRRQPIDIMRQVQIAAGSLVVAGAALAALVSPWFLLLAGFVGAGLVFAGATGFCGMARLLARMPWNRAPAAESGSAVA